MPVIRRTDGDQVNVFAIQYLAVISIRFALLAIFLGKTSCPVLVDITASQHVPQAACLVTNC